MPIMMPSQPQRSLSPLVRSHRYMLADTNATSLSPAGLPDLSSSFALSGIVFSASSPVDIQHITQNHTGDCVTIKAVVLVD